MERNLAVSFSYLKYTNVSALAAKNRVDNLRVPDVSLFKICFYGAMHWIDAALVFNPEW